MGIIDNMLQSESTGFVSLSNCNHSDDKSGGRQPMENGHSAAFAAPPNYKWRRVSAVRDFPPGCGRLAPQIISTAIGEAVVGTDESSVCREETMPLGLHSIVIPGEARHSGEKLLISCDQVDGNWSMNLEPLRMTSSEAQKALNDEVMVESVKPLEHQAVDLSNDLSKMHFSSAVEKTVLHKYPPRRKISAVRDFPSFCGRNAPPLPKDGCTLVVTCTENNSLGQEKLGIGARPTRDMMKTNLMRMVDKVQDGDARPITLERSPSTRVADGVLVAQGKKNQNEFEASFDNVMKGCQEDLPHIGVSFIEDIQQKYGPMTAEDPKSSSCYIAPLQVDRRNQSAAFMEESSDRDLASLSECKTQMSEEDFECFDLMSEKAVVQCLMAAQGCPWRQGKADCKSKSLVGGTAGMKAKKNGLSHKPKNLAGDGAKSEVKRNVSGYIDQAKSISRKKKNVMNVAANSGKRILSETGKAYHGKGKMVELNEEDYQEHDNLWDRRPPNFSVSLPPCPTNLSGEADGNDSVVTRSKVRETLRLFHAICRKLLQAKESKQGNAPRRVDLQASKMLKEKGRYVNVEKIIGPVPGVEVGDEFQYRVELNVVGLHRQIQGGIDYIKQGKKILATSIVASGGYDDNMDDSDVLVYTGSGGNIMGGDKQPEDQKLEQGNLALKNSVDKKNPVRVIRGDTKVSDDGKARIYIYDGLYVVEKWWQEMGQHGKLVFKFKLVRMQGQPQLAWKVVKKSKKFKVREGLCAPDISDGEEVIPICAINTINDEKSPAFQYVTRMIYPNWICPAPPKGCGCTNGCTESERCACVMKNGGEIPFNHNGAIVEAKSVVYECGPACKCPPSCHNRVSQNGIKFQLEIFKTESRGWGVRSLNSIPSGSFICEYLGELLEEKEADQRTGNDEYLFDIGNQYDDGSLWGELSALMPEAHLSSHEVVEGSSFTIDAALCGNIGRFINHSCSPNLYAQNVLYDHEDKRIPHIMFFAAENIPPLQELTYHYNYVIDQVLDSNGNIKRKNCYCGSLECTGRMY